MPSGEPVPTAPTGWPTPGSWLAGKRILVTGASRGLGRAFALAFAEEGADVAINYSRDEEGAKATAAAVQACGRQALVCRASVADAPAVEGMVRTVLGAWDGIDVLVNNAGISQPLPLALMDEEDWDRLMDVNLKGAFLCSRAVLRGMIRARSGCVLNIGSLAGTRMLEAPVHYYTSKAGIKGMTEVVAKEVARYGIRVNCLAPGLLDEGVARNLPEYRLDDYLKHCALGRIGTLGEVARFAVFLVSDRNSYMTGETIIIDGGV